MNTTKAPGPDVQYRTAIRAFLSLAATNGPFAVTTPIGTALREEMIARTIAHAAPFSIPVADVTGDIHEFLLHVASANASGFTVANVFGAPTFISQCHQVEAYLARRKTK